MLIGLALMAGMVRGYSGFGFAMLLALGLMTVWPATVAVPVALMLDLVCSLGLWPGAWRSFHAGIGARLVLGMLLAVPLGALLLSSLPAGVMQPLVAALCLAGGVSVLLRPPSVAADPARGLRLALPAGALSGLAMTLASAGGPPLMLYLLRGSGLDSHRLRATAILFFAASSACSLLGLWLFGAVGREHLVLAAQLLLPALAGNLAGQFLYQRWTPVSLQGCIGLVLVGLSGWLLWRSLGG